VTRPTGLRIVAVHTIATGATGAADEWVAIANEGPESCFDHDWELGLEGDKANSDLVYRFPLLIPGDDGWWTFDPGEVIFLFTAPGRDHYVPHPSGGRRPQFQFHWGRHEPAWDRPGRKLELREIGGIAVAEPFVLPGTPARAVATAGSRS
jgi:hypothetical protein